MVVLCLIIDGSEYVMRCEIKGREEVDYGRVRSDRILRATLGAVKVVFAKVISIVAEAYCV